MSLESLKHSTGNVVFSPPLKTVKTAVFFPALLRIPSTEMDHLPRSQANLLFLIVRWPFSQTVVTLQPHSNNAWAMLVPY